MKKLIYISFLVLLMADVCAQQAEGYANYIYNQFALNPAVAGTSNCTDIKFGSRFQWVGFDNAPITSFVSIHKAFGSSDPNSPAWHGIGLYVVDDRTGLFRRTGVYPAYAYHLRFSRKVIGSVGVFAGFRNQKFAGPPGSADPIIDQAVSTYIFPDIGVGGLIYSKRSFLSVSLKQLYKQDMSGVDGNRVGLMSRSVVQLNGTAGTRFDTQRGNAGYTPSFNVKYGRAVPLSVELTLMGHYAQDYFNLGVSYRVSDAAIVLLEFKLMKQIDLGYAYEYPLSDIRVGTAQTHEIMLKWDPCWKNEKHHGNVDCPVF